MHLNGILARRPTNSLYLLDLMPPKKKGSALQQSSAFNWFSSAPGITPLSDVDWAHVPGPPLTAIPESAATTSFVVPRVTLGSGISSLAGSPAPSPTRSIRALPAEVHTDFVTTAPPPIAENNTPQADQTEFNITPQIVAPTSFLYPQAPPTAPRAWSPPPGSAPDADFDAEDGDSNNDQPVLEGYMRKRRDLLDILKELHSTGCVVRLSSLEHIH